MYRRKFINNPMMISFLNMIKFYCYLIALCGRRYKRRYSRIVGNLVKIVPCVAVARFFFLVKRLKLKSQDRNSAHITRIGRIFVSDTGVFIIGNAAIRIVGNADLVRRTAPAPAETVCVNLGPVAGQIIGFGFQKGLVIGDLRRALV